jgi:hypothetical protein
MSGNTIRSLYPMAQKSRVSDDKLREYAVDLLINDVLKPEMAK